MCAGRREELILQRKRALKSQHAVAAEIGISQAGYSHAKRNVVYVCSY